MLELIERYGLDIGPDWSSRDFIDRNKYLENGYVRRPRISNGLTEEPELNFSTNGKVTGSSLVEAWVEIIFRTQTFTGSN